MNSTQPVTLSLGANDRPSSIWLPAGFADELIDTLADLVAYRTDSGDVLISDAGSEPAK